MNMQPIETLEEIISYIPTHLLYDKCLINKTWYILVNRELKQRLEKIVNELYECDQSLEDIGNKLYWADIMGEYEQEDKYLEQSSMYNDKRWEIIGEKLEIMDKMMKYGMLSINDICKYYDVDEGDEICY